MPLKRVLHLPLKTEYFNAIKSGTKKEEYRLVNPYWTKRIVGREFDAIELTLGYPKAGDESRRLHRPWRGYYVERMQHPLFGFQRVPVFAIRVNT